MTDRPMERFDRLLKAMAQGEPPKAPKPKSGDSKEDNRDAKAKD